MKTEKSFVQHDWQKKETESSFIQNVLPMKTEKNV